MVYISYYGDGDFTITQPKWGNFGPTDTVTYHTDDPGELILRLDDGEVYHSATGDIVLTGQQLANSKTVRCSMLTPEGTRLGWEVAHEDQYGGDTPSIGGGGGPNASTSFWSWLAGLLGIK